MTKITLHSAYQFIALPFLLLSYSSCKKINELSDNSSNPQVLSAAKTTGGTKPSTVATVYLSVVVDNTDPNGLSYKIQNDGNSLYPNSAYVNGQQGVSAYLDQYGNLQFSTNSGMTRRSGAAARSLNFYFDDPCTECGTTVAGTALTNSNGNYRMVTANDGQIIQKMGVGEANAITIRMGGGFASQISSSTDWNFTFKYNSAQINNPYMNLVKVTRESTTKWTITSEVSRPVAGLNNNGVLSYYYLPFKLTLEALP